MSPNTEGVKLINPVSTKKGKISNFLRYRLIIFTEWSVQLGLPWPWRRPSSVQQYDQGHGGPGRLVCGRHWEPSLQASGSQGSAGPYGQQHQSSCRNVKGQCLGSGGLK